MSEIRHVPVATIRRNLLDRVRGRRHRPAVIEPAGIEAADAYCRYLASHHYENFSVASLVLPKEIRLHLARIYAFARTTDDLGDESGPEGLERLARWREEVERYFADRSTPVHPVLLALSRTVAPCGLTVQPFLDLIAANVQDQTVHRYETWQDLQAYCLLSAAPVGRLVLRVFGVDQPRAESLSDDVCIGLQLANFAQDVRGDAAKGRIYLLQSEIGSHGPTEAVRMMCDRAERLLASGRELEAMVPRRLRLQLALYRLGGTAIVTEIRQMNYRTDVRRPTVGLPEKLRIGLFALAQSRGKRDYAPRQGMA